MKSQREKLQYIYVFCVDLIALALSMVIGWGVIDNLMGKMGAYQPQDSALGMCMLVLA